MITSSEKLEFIREHLQRQRGIDLTDDQVLKYLESVGASPDVYYESLHAIPQEQIDTISVDDKVNIDEIFPEIDEPMPPEEDTQEDVVITPPKEKKDGRGRPRTLPDTLIVESRRRASRKYYLIHREEILEKLGKRPRHEDTRRRSMIIKVLGKIMEFEKNGRRTTFSEIDDNTRRRRYPREKKRRLIEWLIDQGLIRKDKKRYFIESNGRIFYDRYKNL